MNKYIYHIIESPGKCMKDVSTFIPVSTREVNCNSSKVACIALIYSYTLSLASTV